jgi:glutamate-1-semialdehyde 2,1-aminomutase
MSDIPKSQELFARAVEYLPGGNSRNTVFMRPHPPYVESGQGAYIRDFDGNRILDCNNNYTSLILGHCDFDVMESVSTVLARGWAYGLPTEYEIELAQTLSKRFNVDWLWRFVNSGTEATMLAIRIARAYTGRNLVLKFVGAYHGSYEGTQDYGVPGVSKGSGQEVLSIQMNDLQALDEIFTIKGADIACVILDLMPNRAGLSPADSEFVSHIRQYATKNGSLLILDEVMSFRLGYGGFHESYKVRPDLITLGKIVGGGFPAGAVGGSSKFMNIVSPGEQGILSWGGTFNANPISMAAGVSTLDKFDMASVESLNNTGNRLRQNLSEIGVRVSGYGSLLRIFSPKIEETWWMFYASGLLIGTNGLMALSTAMNEDDIEKIYRTIYELRDHLLEVNE